TRRALSTTETVDRGACDEIAVKRDRATGIIVAGDREIDAIGIAVRVHDRDDRDLELLRFLDRDVLLVRVDNEQEIRQTAHVTDAAEALIELVALAREVEQLLLGASLRITAEYVVELAQTSDRLRDRLPVGQRAAQPAVIDV